MLPHLFPLVLRLQYLVMRESVRSCHCLCIPVTNRRLKNSTQSITVSQPLATPDPTPAPRPRVPPAPTPTPTTNRAPNPPNNPRPINNRRPINSTVNKAPAKERLPRLPRPNVSVPTRQLEARTYLAIISGASKIASHHLPAADLLMQRQTAEVYKFLEEHQINLQAWRDYTNSTAKPSTRKSNLWNCFQGSALAIEKLKAYPEYDKLG
jgi:hypothetical protein